MPLQTALAVLVFASVMAFTPGPNNVMLASSGARFGLARTLPHLAGVTVGFPVMLLLVGLGLASILLASPLLQTVMKIVSCAYLLWLAFQIGRSDTVMGDGGAAKPLTFLQAGPNDARRAADRCCGGLFSKIFVLTPRSTFPCPAVLSRCAEKMAPARPISSKLYRSLRRVAVCGAPN